ncbi:hypothetical protein QYE76_013330 [Lolium multiflorum]|uniref:RNase H type-1 domain-containing protein n=1 Tax=Lolium multiflorum TaxID=4521 RepID=A0AAD8X4G7_LOLMU|nr:hypothetical protein QYE76_013330 [Lolium multiflorum]
MALVKIKSDDEFHWGAEQQRAFDEIKRYLTTPPVLVPPQQDRLFYIYLSVADTSIASVVVQLYEGVEKVVFYLSRRMLDAETRYPEVEKLCLCLFFTCTKLHHILLTAEIIIICKSDVVKHMLSAPVLKGRLALSIRAWAMFFDGSACDDGCGIGTLLVSPRGATYSFSIRLSTPCTNNVAEYEAIRKGMELLLEAGAEAVELFGDSKLVISQLTDEYKCESESLFPYWMECRELMAKFQYINFNWVPRSQNTEANDLTQMASGYKDIPDETKRSKSITFPTIGVARPAPRRTCVPELRAVVGGTRAALGCSPFYVLPPLFSGFDANTFSHPVGQSSTSTASPSTPEMAEGTPVTYEDLTEELKKKYDEVKAILEADLIGSFQRTRSHGIRWKGFSPEGALDGVDLSTPSEERTRSRVRRLTSW